MLVASLLSVVEDSQHAEATSLIHASSSAKNRQAFLDEVTAQTDEYDVLIVDRFFLSILAMQGCDDEDIRLINYIRDSVCNGRREHIIFHMRTPPEVCKSRLMNKIVPDRIEEKGVEFHRMVFDRYLTLLRNEENVYHIDGSGGIEEIHRAIVDKTLLLLGAAGGERTHVGASTVRTSTSA